jgi:peptide/nickel transport system substrate-binding protein
MISPAAIADPSIDLASTPGPAGSGPYMIEELRPGERVTLVRSQVEYWEQGAGNLARLNIVFVSDSRTRFNGLQAGDYDVAYIQPIEAASIAEARQMADTGEYVYATAPTAVLIAVLMKSNVAPFDDPAVRQALIQATDRESIVDGLFEGTCEASSQPMSEGFPGHVDGLEDPFPYDPDAARAALEGTPLDVTIGVIAGRKDLPAVLQAQWAEVGVTAEVAPMASVDVLQAFYKGNTNLWAYQMLTSLTPVAAAADFFLAPNWIAADDPDMAALVEQATASTEPAEIAAIGDELMELAVAGAYQIPICHIDAHYLARAGVAGLDSIIESSAQFSVDLRFIGVEAG